jgi:hypothetical protein
MFSAIGMLRFSRLHWSEDGIDRMDAGLFVLMILSRTAQSAAAFSGLRSLTKSSTRTQCYPSDQGRFLDIPPQNTDDIALPPVVTSRVASKRSK